MRKTVTVDKMLCVPCAQMQRGITPTSFLRFADVGTCARCGEPTSRHYAVQERPAKPTYEKRRAVLKNWSVFVRMNVADTGLKLCLRGEVYGHETFGEGQHIYTSPLLRLDIPARTAETLNTVYSLG